MNDDDLAGRIAHAVMEEIAEELDATWWSLISYQRDNLRDAVRDAVQLAIEQHQAPLGR